MAKRFPLSPAPNPELMKLLKQARGKPQPKPVQLTAEEFRITAWALSYYSDELADPISSIARRILRKIGQDGKIAARRGAAACE